MSDNTIQENESVVIEDLTVEEIIDNMINSKPLDSEFARILDENILDLF